MSGAATYTRSEARAARTARQLTADLRRARKPELLALVMELASRSYEATDATRLTTINGPRNAWRELRDVATRRTECLAVLCLDAQNAIIHREVLSIGSLNTTRTHPREILRPAIVHGALGLILGHNHPSGKLDPSPEDVEFTRTVTRAGELMGIELYDHLILTGHGYTSMRERGLL